MTFRLTTANFSGTAQDRWVSCAVPTALLSGAAPGYEYSSPSGNVFVVGNEIGPNLSMLHLHRNFGAYENGTIEVNPESSVKQCRYCQETDPTGVTVSGFVDGKYCFQEIEFDRIAYSDAVLTVYEAHQRMTNIEHNATKLSVDAYYYRWANHPISTLELAIVASNPAVDSQKANIQNLRVRLTDADAAICRWSNYQQVAAGATANELLLVSGSDYIADGQALPGYVIDFLQTDAAPGDWSPYAGAAGGAAYVMVHPEDLEGHFFSLGGIPDLLPADDTAGRGHGLSAIQELLSYWSGVQASATRWDAPGDTGGCTEYPGNTGEQPDFGNGVPNYVLSAGSLAPWGLDMAYAGAMREWIRAGAHYRNEDGTRIDLGDYPNVHTWGDQRHWSSAYSPERFGQSHDYMPSGSTAHGISSRSIEHFTANQLTATYALTGSFLLRDRVLELGDAVSKCWTGYESGDYTALYMNIIADGHRFDGRCATTAARCYWATGNENALAAMRQRYKAKIQGAYERFGWWSWGGIFKDQMTRDYDLFVCNLDVAASGYFGGAPWWGPWQIGPMIEGIEQARIETGDPAWSGPYGHYDHPWAAVLTKLCRSWIRHGWIYDSEADRYFCAKAIKWDYVNGDQATGFTRPVPDSAYLGLSVSNDDQPWIKDDRGTAYNFWNWTGAKIALGYLTEESDIAKCQAILAQNKQQWLAGTGTGFTGDTFQVAQRYGVADTGQGE